MNIKRTVLVALSIAVISAATASVARADEWNKLTYLTFSREEVEKGFARADHIFEDTFRFQKVQHYSLEAHNNVEFALTPAGTETTVKWSIFGPMLPAGKCP